MFVHFVHFMISENIRKRIMIRKVSKCLKISHGIQDDSGQIQHVPGRREAASTEADHAATTPSKEVEALLTEEPLT